VKTTYKSYATESAIEIIRKGIVPYLYPPQSSIDLIALRVDSFSRPTSEDNNGGPEGARVMNCLPREPLQVASFKQLKVKDGKNSTNIDAKVHLDKVVYAMQGAHGENTEIGRLWSEFASTFPKGTAAEYIEAPNNNYHVPFKEFFDRTADEVSGLQPVNHEERQANLSDSSLPEGAAGDHEHELLRGFSTACATWGPQGKGFQGFGLKSAPHARELYPGQGLSGEYLVPEPVREGVGAPKNLRKKGKAYKYWKKDELKFELDRRGLEVSGKNAEMIQRLTDDDHARRNLGVAHGMAIDQENENRNGDNENDVEQEENRNEDEIVDNNNDNDENDNNSNDASSVCSSVNNLENEEENERRYGKDESDDDSEEGIDG
jgi:hypothetical protein